MSSPSSTLPLWYDLHPPRYVKTFHAFISFFFFFFDVAWRTVQLNLISCPQLCYLYADFYKQTNSKETRRVFIDLHTFFIDRGAVSAVFAQFITDYILN